MRQGLVNLWSQGKEGGYVVQHSQNAVSDFPVDGEDSENFWEKAYPLLFPYGRGGLEKNRQTRLSLAEHAKWALEYFDGCFQVHPTFSFLAFGILQRRQALLSTLR